MSRFGDSLAAAIQWVLQNRDEGVVCPCCGQRAQTYRRTITSQMARGLIALGRRKGIGEFEKLEALAGSNGELVRLWRGDFAKLRFWGLIQGVELTAEEQEAMGKKDSNVWAITAQGVEFAMDRLKVSKVVMTFNNQVLGFDGPTISIHDTLGKHFNYNEVMSGKL
jgi:hypothetical protein